MNNVACVWIPPKYNISYVEILYNSVKRNSEKPFNFYCLTTHPQDITNPNIIPISLEVDPMFESDTKKWWYKCNLFNKHNWEGQVLYLDLDTVVTGSLDKFFEWETDQFRICQDFNRHGIADYSISNSSVIGFQANAYTNIYNDFQEEKTENIRRHKGDQDWLSRVFPEDTKKWWPKEWAMSYKWEVLNGGLKRMGTTEYKSDRTVLHDDTSILVFHGKPNPSDVLDDPLISENWK
jgi:hypothetical protein